MKCTCTATARRLDDFCANCQAEWSDWLEGELRQARMEQAWTAAQQTPPVRREWPHYGPTVHRMLLALPKGRTA
jgi:hypothetical protein